MSNIKDFTRYFKNFKSGIFKLKNYYNNFSLSLSISIGKNSMFDSSVRGTIVNQYVEKAARKLIMKNQKELFEKAAKMMEDDMNEGLEPEKPPYKK